MLFFKVNNEFYIKLSKTKDLSRLVKKVIVDKNGYRKTVYVKIYDIESKKKQLNKFIESIRKEKIEHSLVIDANYNVILYKSGDAKGVKYTKREIIKINNSYKLIHNHSTGESLSPQDLFFALGNSIQNFEIVGMENNRKVNYSLKILKEIPYETKSRIIKIYINLFLINRNLEIKNPSNVAMKSLIKDYGEYLKYEYNRA